MLFNCHIPAHATCFAGKVCGPVRSTWGTSLGEDKLGARARMLHTNVARRACTGQIFPQVGVPAVSVLLSGVSIFAAME